MSDLENCCPGERYPAADRSHVVEVCGTWMRRASKTGHIILNDLNVVGVRHWCFKHGKTTSHWFTPDTSHLGTVVVIETQPGIAQKLHPAHCLRWLALEISHLAFEGLGLVGFGFCGRDMLCSIDYILMLWLEVGKWSQGSAAQIWSKMLKVSCSLWNIRTGQMQVAAVAILQWIYASRQWRRCMN